MLDGLLNRRDLNPKLSESKAPRIANLVLAIV